MNFWACLKKYITLLQPCYSFRFVLINCLIWQLATLTDYGQGQLLLYRLYRDYNFFVTQTVLHCQMFILRFTKVSNGNIPVSKTCILVAPIKAIIVPRDIHQQVHGWENRNTFMLCFGVATHSALCLRVKFTPYQQVTHITITITISCHVDF